MGNAIFFERWEKQVMISLRIGLNVLLSAWRESLPFMELVTTESVTETIH